MALNGLIDVPWRSRYSLGTMKPSGETLHEDDASGEAWFQKGVSVLEEKKRDREFEELLKKQMAHPAVFEPANISTTKSPGSVSMRIKNSGNFPGNRAG